MLKKTIISPNTSFGDIIILTITDRRRNTPGKGKSCQRNTPGEGGKSCYRNTTQCFQKII